MNSSLGYRLAVFLGAPGWSPVGLVRRACFICLTYLVVRLAGMQQFATVLNGTTGSMWLGWEVSALLGMVFIAVYLALVLLVPVFVLGAAVLAAWNYFSPTGRRS